MAVPTFGGFSLQDSNYITSNIEFRTWPRRNISIEEITRKPGAKLLSEEFGERVIGLRGYILGSGASDLRDKIDDFQQNVSKIEQSLIIETGRTFTATARSVAIADPTYAVDMVPFDLEFVCADPFSYGNSQTVNISVTSGVASEDYTVTISGTFFAEPMVVYSTISGVTGTTTTSGVILEIASSGETITWSGAGTPLDYGDSLTFNYQTYRVLKNTTSQNFWGMFSRWEPGSNTFTATYSGTTQGGQIALTYSPRYL